MIQPAVSPTKGGAQWNTARLAIGLANRGHEVRLVGEFHTIPEMSRAIDQAGITVTPLRIHAGGFKSLLKLAREIRSFNPEVVHSCLRSGDVAAGLVCLVLGKPLISTVGEKLPTTTDITDGIGWKGHIHKLLLRRKFSRVAATSEFALAHLISYSRISPNKVKVIPNGIDTDEFRGTDLDSAAEIDSQSSSGSVVLGFAGRIAPEKRLDLLPELIEQLATRKIDVRALVAGRGISERDIRQLVSGSGISDRVTFLGAVNDMPKFYRTVDIMVHFGTVEGFGLVVAESMAAGVPVVAADAGGVAEIIQNGTDGVLVSPYSVTEYADRIEEICSDPSLYEKLSANAKATAYDQFSLDRFIGSYEDLYLDSIGQQVG